MQYAKVDLCFDDFLLKKSSQTTNSLDFNMIVYVDSSECTPCELGHLRFWNPLIKESLEKSKYKTGLTIILAPKEKDWFDLNEEIKESDIPANIYIDSTYVFLKNNPFIPKEKKYHSFLLNKNNEIILVGNPVNNKRIKNIYRNYILNTNKR